MTGRWPIWRPAIVLLRSPPCGTVVARVRVLLAARAPRVRRVANRSRLVASPSRPAASLNRLAATPSRRVVTRSRLAVIPSLPVVPNRPAAAQSRRVARFATPRAKPLVMRNPTATG